MALDEKGFAGLGVATQTILPLSDLEGAESGQLDRLAAQNGLGDLLDHKVQSLTNSFPWKSGSATMVSGILNNVRSIQWIPPYFGS
jgi:hypothetical protein